ncbi:hypothetical protein KP509_35G016600 [Ceratopteris richardii]|uniref:Uncharacterized protein n=1 Tax=Ceratopteris richardii TaxID=49495 RepID=A0A8T2QFG9_CERRI|nr:hypothetical protein KP509_35G016600 [Ceratopteris richardii]
MQKKWKERLNFKISHPHSVYQMITLGAFLIWKTSGNQGQISFLQAPTLGVNQYLATSPFMKRTSTLKAIISSQT